MSYILTHNKEKEDNKESGKVKYLGNDTNIDIKVKRNHIYFYSDVNKKSAMDLNTKIKDIESTLVDRYREHNFHKEYIYLHINSYGGCVFSALSIIDTIKNCKVPIVSIIEGAAASAATLISVSCDYRLINKNAYMLIHQLSSSYWGKIDDIEEEVTNLKELMKKIKQIYSDNTKIEQGQLDEMLKHDLWWNSDICLEYGLNDRIINNEKLYSFSPDELQI
jgi:ATP-dependent protease ClpP protease subunit